MNMNKNKTKLIESIKQQNLKTDIFNLCDVNHDICAYGCFNDLNLIDAGLKDFNENIIQGATFNENFYKSMVSDSIELSKSIISEYLYKNISVMILDLINLCIKPGDFTKDELNESIKTLFPIDDRIYFSSYANIAGASIIEFVNGISNIADNMDESKDLKVDYMAGNMLSNMILFVDRIALSVDCTIHSMIGKKYLINSANQKFKSVEEFIDTYLGETYKFNICDFRNRISCLCLDTLKLISGCKIRTKQNLLYPGYDEYVFY